MVRGQYGSCANCGEFIGIDDRIDGDCSECEQCGNLLCMNCSRDCYTCGAILCEECSTGTSCDLCGEFSCGDCFEECERCGEEYCGQCMENKDGEKICKKCNKK